MTIRTIAGERYVYQKRLEADSHYYFVSGFKVAVARMSIGWGPVETVWEINSRGLQRNEWIPSIATTESALRDQYFEHEARWLAPWGRDWLPQDYDLDGDLDTNLSPFAPPQVFEGEGAGLNAWEIHTGRFKYHGDADAKFIAIVVFIREVDVPYFKEYPNGFNTRDVIGTEPGFLRRGWQWLTE